MVPRFNENFNNKCYECEALGYFGKDLGYQCKRHYCTDNSHFALYVFGERKEERKGEKHE